MLQWHASFCFPGYMPYPPCIWQQRILILDQILTHIDEGQRGHVAHSQAQERGPPSVLLKLKDSFCFAILATWQKVRRAYIVWNGNCFPEVYEKLYIGKRKIKICIQIIILNHSPFLFILIYDVYLLMYNLYITVLCFLSVTDNPSSYCTFASHLELWSRPIFSSKDYKLINIACKGF